MVLDNRDGKRDVYYIITILVKIVFINFINVIIGN